jgi:hypothetical protein
MRAIFVMNLFDWYVRLLLSFNNSIGLLISSIHCVSVGHLRGLVI